MHKTSKKWTRIASIAVFIICVLVVMIYAERFLFVNPHKIRGSGTEKDPYLIENKASLEYFRDLVNHGTSFEDCYVLQTDNIDLEGKEWTPIGIARTKFVFKGVYDGGCHTIENLVIPEKYKKSIAFVGFFGCLGGTVKNLGIESGKIHGEYVGSIASYRLQKSNAVILNCYNKAELIGTERAGGICDQFSSCQVINCINQGKVTAPVSADIVSYNAAFVTGQEKENSVSAQFKGAFYQLDMPGNTIYEQMNAGLETLFKAGIVQKNNVRMWG